MLTTNAVFSRKEPNLEPKACVVDKVIQLSAAEYDRFSHNQLRDWGFIRDNPIDIVVDKQGRYHCLLVTGEGRRDGILVNPEGSDYARYSALVPNVDGLLTVGQYPALAELNKKLADIVDYIAEQPGESAVIDLRDLKTEFGLDLMTNSVLRRTALDMLDQKPRIIDCALDKNELSLYYAQEQASAFEVFIVNEDRRENGEWLELPTSAELLGALFTRIGVVGPYDEGYVITDFRSSYPGVVEMLRNSDSLDELNMLAEYRSDMDSWEMDKLQAALVLNIDSTEDGAAYLINLLYAENFDVIDLIGAANAEELGRYWEQEDPMSYPEGLSHAEHGRALIADEEGIFTQWGYVCFRNKELSEEYDGIVPQCFRVLDDALLIAARHSKRQRDAVGAPDDKQSVLKQLRAARTVPPAPKQKHKRDKGGHEL